MTIGLTLAVALATCSLVLFSSRAGRLVERAAARAAVIIVLLVLTSCVRQATPAPAEQRTTPPPWNAPRDAISYITAAGLEAQPISNENSRVVKLRITVDGAPVEVPANVGIDRVRALQAPVHTHDTSGQVWLEGRETEAVTLGQFFTVWVSGSMINVLVRHAEPSWSMSTAKPAQLHARCGWQRVASSTSRQRPSRRLFRVSAG